ncbi:MAG TPA: hypothetical protein VFW23_16170 [Tepidisphaeraceae bacterium]|nr:hypothetical protein [Tepidisphaeraceae bacterium]
MGRGKRVQAQGAGQRTLPAFTIDLRDEGCETDIRSLRFMP